MTHHPIQRLILILHLAMQALLQQGVLTKLGMFSFSLTITARGRPGPYLKRFVWLALSFSYLHQLALLAGFSLTFEVEGHCLVSKQVYRGMLLWEFIKTQSLPEVHFPAIWKINLLAKRHI